MHDGHWDEQHLITGPAAHRHRCCQSSLRLHHTNCVSDIARKALGNLLLLHHNCWRTALHLNVTKSQSDPHAHVIWAISSTQWLSFPFHKYQSERKEHYIQLLQSAWRPVDGQISRRVLVTQDDVRLIRVDAWVDGQASADLLTGEVTLHTGRHVHVSHRHAQHLHLLLIHGLEAQRTAVKTWRSQEIKRFKTLIYSLKWLKSRAARGSWRDLCWGQTRCECGRRHAQRSPQRCWWSAGDSWWRTPGGAERCCPTGTRSRFLRTQQNNQCYDDDLLHNTCLTIFYICIRLFSICDS